MCPPGVDQTTRSAQQWFLLSPTCEEKIRATIGRYTSRHETLLSFLSNLTSSEIFEALAGPSDDRAVPSTTTTVHQTLSSIEALPAELIGIVLSQLEQSRKDIIAFGACSGILWTHVLRYIAADCRKSTGSWAGYPLLCTGTWLVDLPPALYGLDPKLQVEQDHWDALPLRSRYGPCPAREWNWNAVSLHKQLRTTNYRWKKSAERVLRKQYPALYSAIADVLQRPHRTVQGKWVLRNLTQKEFVRFNITEGENGRIHAVVADAPGISLDKALMLRICWSCKFTDFPGISGKGKAYEVSLRTGAWAGHAFDLRKHHGTSSEGWQDVTVALIQHASTLGLLEALSEEDSPVTTLFAPPSEGESDEEYEDGEDS